MRDWFATQFLTKSTLTGIVSAVALLAGWHLAPDRIDAIATVTTTVASLVLVVTKEG